MKDLIKAFNLFLFLFLFIGIYWYLSNNITNLFTKTNSLDNQTKSIKITTLTNTWNIIKNWTNTWNILTNTWNIIKENWNKNKGNSNNTILNITWSWFKIIKNWTNTLITDKSDNHIYEWKYKPVFYKNFYTNRMEKALISLDNIKKIKKSVNWINILYKSNDWKDKAVVFVDKTTWLQRILLRNDLFAWFNYGNYVDIVDFDLMKDKKIKIKYIWYKWKEYEKITSWDILEFWDIKYEKKWNLDFSISADIKWYYDKIDIEWINNWEKRGIFTINNEYTGSTRDIDLRQIFSWLNNVDIGMNTYILKVYSQNKIIAEKKFFHEVTWCVGKVSSLKNIFTKVDKNTRITSLSLANNNLYYVISKKSSDNNWDIPDYNWIVELSLEKISCESWNKNTLYSKKWPIWLDVVSDSDYNKITINWLYNNKLLFSTNEEWWKYIFRSNYLYDFWLNKVIKLVNSWFSKKIEEWNNWIYVSYRSPQANNKLVLITKDNEEIIIFEDTASSMLLDAEKYPVWYVELQNFELLQNNDIKLNIIKVISSGVEKVNKIIKYSDVIENWKVKDLWNWFKLNQTLDKTLLLYKWNKIYSWSHISEKLPFIWDEWCDKLSQEFIKFWNKWVWNWKQSIWDSFWENNRKKCLKDYYYNSLSISKIDQVFYTINKVLYEWITKIIFDSSGNKVIQNKLKVPFDTINRIEKWKSWIYILYHWSRWNDWGLVFIYKITGKQKILFRNTDVSINNINYRDIIDFKLMINKQVKIFYKWKNAETKEMIVNL